jgi:AI-2 transport protein TqsA
MNLPLQGQFSSSARSIIVGAAIILIMLGMKLMAFIINAAFLAVVITVALSPVVNWFRSKRLSRGLATGITILLMIIGVLVMMVFFVYSVDQLLKSLPAYRADLPSQITAGSSFLAIYNIDASRVSVLLQKFADSGLAKVGEALSNITSILTQISLAVLASAFMLLEAGGFSSRLTKQLGADSPTLDNLYKFMRGTRDFFLITTVLGAIEGTIIAIVLYFMKVPFPAMWGFLFWLLNYIPYLGIWLSVLPPFFLALMTLGPTSAFFVLILYAAVSNVFKLLVMPKVMGDKVDTSMTVGFLGLFFWGWELGVIGMLLAYPYTLLVRDVLLKSTNEVWLVDLMKKQDPEAEDT